MEGVLDMSGEAGKETLERLEKKWLSDMLALAVVVER